MIDEREQIEFANKVKVTLQWYFNKFDLLGFYKTFFKLDLSGKTNISYLIGGMPSTLNDIILTDKYGNYNSLISRYFNMGVMKLSEFFIISPSTQSIIKYQLHRERIY